MVNCSTSADQIRIPISVCVNWSAHKCLFDHLSTCYSTFKQRERVEVWMCMPLVCVCVLLKCICTFENITVWVLDKKHMECMFFYWVSQIAIWVFVPLGIGYVWLLLLSLHWALSSCAFMCIYMCVSFVWRSLCVCEREWYPPPHSSAIPHPPSPHIPPSVPPAWVSLLPPPGSLLIFLYQIYQTSPFFCPPSNMPCQIA